MYRPVVLDDTTVTEIVDIDLLHERLSYDGLVLTTVELLEHVRCVTLVGQLRVIVREAAGNSKNFAHQVNDRVLEVEYDHCRIRIVKLLFEVFFAVDHAVD